MFGFRRKKKDAGTAGTFVEATGGGWTDAPGRISVDGGSHAGFVGEFLQRASDYARENDIAVGEQFDFAITDLPRGIISPHEIVFAIMMKAQEYNLSSVAVYDETARFMRLE